MLLRVRVQEVELIMPCGNGSQSFKWLALAASQRCITSVPHGRTRVSGDSRMTPGFFLPSCVSRATDGHVFEPHARLVDHCQSGDLLIVSLQESIAVDALGTPQRSEWSLTAFFSSQMHIAQPIPLLSGSRKTMSMQESMQSYAQSQAHMQVQSNCFFSEQETDVAFAYDFKRLHLDRLDIQDKDSVQRVLLQCYPTLSAAYSYYAIACSESVFGMNGWEFAHFAQECELLSLPKDLKALRDMISSTLSLSPIDFGAVCDRQKLSRAGFLHVFLRVIVHAKEDMLSFLRETMQEKVMSFVQRKANGLSHRSSIAAVLQSYYPKLIRVFERLGTRTACDSKTWPSYPTTDAIAQLFVESGLMQDTAIFEKSAQMSLSALSDPEIPLIFAEFVHLIHVFAQTSSASQDIPLSLSLELTIQGILTQTQV